LSVLIFDLTANTNARKIMILNTSLPEDKTVKSTDGTAIFSVAVSEDGRPKEYSYQWFIDGTLVSGATSNSYVRDVTGDIGQHSVWCEVSNKAGTARSREAKLTVNRLPVLSTSYPADATVEKGDSVTAKVSIAAAGYPASYTYQWYKNGSAVSGATGSSYTFTAGTAGDVELYCKVSNSAGTVTSRTATIKVKDVLVLIPGDLFSGATKVNPSVTITKKSDGTYEVSVPINGGAGVAVDVTAYNTMEIHASYNTADDTTPYIGLFSKIWPDSLVVGYEGGGSAATVNEIYDISSVTGTLYFGLYNTTAAGENETKVFQLHRVVFKE
jgi:hypothetical protein